MPIERFFQNEVIKTIDKNPKTKNVVQKAYSYFFEEEDVQKKEEAAECALDCLDLLPNEPFLSDVPPEYASLYQNGLNEVYKKAGLEPKEDIDLQNVTLADIPSATGQVVVFLRGQNKLIYYDKNTHEQKTYIGSSGENDKDGWINKERSGDKKTPLGVGVLPKKRRVLLDYEGKRYDVKTGFQTDYPNASHKAFYKENGTMSPEIVDYESKIPEKKETAFEKHINSVKNWFSETVLGNEPENEQKPSWFARTFNAVNTATENNVREAKKVLKKADNVKNKVKTNLGGSILIHASCREDSTREKLATEDVSYGCISLHKDDMAQLASKLNANSTYIILP